MRRDMLPNCRARDLPETATKNLPFRAGGFLAARAGTSHLYKTTVACQRRLTMRKELTDCQSARWGRSTVILQIFPRRRFGFGNSGFREVDRFYFSRA